MPASLSVALEGGLGAAEPIGELDQAAAAVRVVERVGKVHRVTRQSTLGLLLTRRD